MKITRFTLNKHEKNLTIDFVEGKVASFTFEYLRVFSPQKTSKNQSLITHKKLITLISIENVGKHGYRFIFDDQHSAIYSVEYLTTLFKEYQQRWQHYLTELKASGHSREAMINITQL